MIQQAPDLPCVYFGDVQLRILLAAENTIDSAPVTARSVYTSRVAFELGAVRRAGGRIRRRQNKEGAELERAACSRFA